MTTQLTKTEAFAQGRFERVEFNTVASTRKGKVWLQGFVTYRRYPYEAPITEGFQAELDPRLLAAAPRMLDLIRDLANAQGVDPDRCKRWTESARALLSRAYHIAEHGREIHGEG